jgi:hypothetical protein
MELKLSNHIAAVFVQSEIFLNIGNALRMKHDVPVLHIAQVYRYRFGQFILGARGSIFRD